MPYVYVFWFYVFPGLISLVIVLLDSKGNWILGGDPRVTALKEDWAFILVPVLNWIGSVALLCGLLAMAIRKYKGLPAVPPPYRD